ncbi:hypothetical protein NP493_6342g00000 [Ridgeia piscesae]|uniref:Uncharacterized protein n=1 Tax=Ridgeia piscesae TaxID=27915 RepID=A0AAD9MLF2_RIDPI|nr:hypothetical protein NP493_6342g00000 [Ridgeia piscesae]
MTVEKGIMGCRLGGVSESASVPPLRVEETDEQRTHGEIQFNVCSNKVVIAADIHSSSVIDGSAKAEVIGTGVYHNKLQKCGIGAAAMVSVTRALGHTPKMEELA